MSVYEPEPVDTVRILDADGHVRDGETVPDVGDDALVSMYRDMKLARRFDERAVRFQRRGEMGTYASMYGHEAAQVASAHALADDDFLVHSYREHAATIVRGVPPEAVLLYHKGHGEFPNLDDDLPVFPICGTVGPQVLHATGYSWAMRLAGDDRATICYFGDGATSEGDVHEGMNFAGVFDTPTVFFCSNNQWAISTPVDRQTAAQTIAQKATAYGFEGVRVDGMDPLAVYAVTQNALEKAKNPDEGELRPTLIEALLFRLGAHNTTDDPSNYRSERHERLREEWETRDPVPRFETFLRETGRLDDERVDAVESEVDEIVADAIEATQQTDRPAPEEMFDDAYAELPDRPRDQRERLLALREEYGDDAFLRDH